ARRRGTRGHRQSDEPLLPRRRELADAGQTTRDVYDSESGSSGRHDIPECHGVPDLGQLRSVERADSTLARAPALRWIYECDRGAGPTRYFVQRSRESVGLALLTRFRIRSNTVYREPRHRQLAESESCSSAEQQLRRLVDAIEDSRTASLQGQRTVRLLN